MTRIFTKENMGGASVADEAGGYAPFVRLKARRQCALPTHSKFFATSDYVGHHPLFIDQHSSTLHLQRMKLPLITAALICGALAAAFSSAPWRDRRVCDGPVPSFEVCPP
jgi:hypothetical protein